MQFQNPWGALALLLAVPLLLLYLLRQRHREVRVPSTLLWNQVLTQWEAAHPWQKWRRNLLFFLQLLAVCLLALALMRPVWKTSGTGQNSIVVLDVSMSMQAEEDGTTRLERAAQGVRTLIDGMQRDGEMSLILAGERTELLVSRSRDREAQLRLLEQTRAQNGGAKLEDAVQMAESLRNDENNAAIHVFTDRPLSVRDEHVVVHNVALGSENVAMTSVSYSRDSRDGRLHVLGLLHNYGQGKTVGVELWGDGALLDVRECALEADGPANVLFEGLDPSLRNLSLAVSEEDALAADNRAYCVVQDSDKYRVLLQTARNVFLEKAILLRDDIELYKTVPAEETTVEGQYDQGQYDLLIGDGWTTAGLPESQDIWLIAPQSDNAWFTMQEAGDTAVRAADTADPLLRHVDLSALRVAKGTGFAVEDPATRTLAYIGDEPLIILGEEDGAKRLAFGFDFHESNLPMQKDFPILVQNILAWFLPLKEGQTGQVAVGDTALISLQGGAAHYDIRLPDGNVLQGQSARQFTETQQPGFYAVTQYDGSGGVLTESGFAVNASASGESELRTAGQTDGGQAAQASELWRRWNIWPYLIIAALLLMSLEWWVYHRGA